MNILLADDHTLFRESLEVILETTFPGSLITSTKNWSEVFDHTDTLSYDLLLLDLFMPDVKFSCWSSSLNRVVNSQTGAVCIISSSSSPEHIQSAFHIGVSGYLCKTASLQEMKQALQQLSEGKTYLPEQMWKKRPYRKGDDQSIHLTGRQQGILELIAEGDSNKTIAHKLGLAESTVKRHAYNLYRVLDAKNRTDAIRIAQLQGLLVH